MLTLDWLTRRMRGTSTRTRIITLVAIAIVALVISAYAAGFLAELIVASVIVAIVFCITRQRRKAKAFKKARIADAELRTDWPARLGPWLLTEEEVRREGRKHPMAILRWWVLCFSGPVLTILVSLVWTNGVAFLILFFGPALFSSWKILVWILEWQVFTNRRVLEVQGVLNVSAPAAPLVKIATAKPVKPWFSRIVLQGAFGLKPYGHITIETNADIEPIPVLLYVRDVEEASRLLQEYLAG